VSDPRDILVVDDDAINRMVVRVLMERRHYRVAEAASGPEALDLVRFRTHNQNMTVAARAIVDRNTLGHRS